MKSTRVLFIALFVIVKVSSLAQELEPRALARAPVGRLEVREAKNQNFLPPASLD
jgi:hypothetical protein